MATTIAYRFPNESSIEELSVGERAEETENTRVNWVAFKQKFFSSVLIAENNFDYASMRYTTFPEGSDELKSFNATMSIPYSNEVTDYKFQYYFGPNKYSILNKCEARKMAWLVDWAEYYWSGEGGSFKVTHIDIEET